MSDFSYGSIVNVDLGSPPDEVRGHEQAYERPCVVLKYFSKLKLAVVLPCTSKKPSKNYYTMVHLKIGTGNLNKDSYVLCHQIRTVFVDRISKVIGHLPEKDFYKIQAVQADILGI